MHSSSAALLVRARCSALFGALFGCTQVATMTSQCLNTLVHYFSATSLARVSFCEALAYI